MKELNEQEMEMVKDLYLSGLKIKEVVKRVNLSEPRVSYYLKSNGLTRNPKLDANELEKIKLESKLPIVLFTNVSKGAKGKNTYQFETQSNRSTAKSPIGMFEDFLIPNSLKLVDDTIRNYYGI